MNVSERVDVVEKVKDGGFLSPAGFVNHQCLLKKTLKKTQVEEKFCHFFCSYTEQTINYKNLLQLKGKLWSLNQKSI